MSYHREDLPGAGVLTVASIFPAAVIAVPFGVGLLPFAPVAGLVFALRWSFAVVATRHGGGRLLFAGLALGAAALVLVDLRVTMTQVALDRYGGDTDARASAVGLMLSWGDPALLLRQSYGDSGRAGGIGSFLASAWTNGTLFGERPRTADGRVFAVTDLAVYAVAIVIASQLDNYLRPKQRTGWVSDYAGQQQYATICGKRGGCSATAAMMAGCFRSALHAKGIQSCMLGRMSATHTTPQDAARPFRSAGSR